MIKKITATIFFALLVLGATQVRAQECARISFAHGRTTAVINGRVDAKKSPCYELRARKGLPGNPAGLALGQERESKMLDPTRVPLEAARVEGFVPRGWKIHSQARGDLNNDGRMDVALILFDKLMDDAMPRSVENPQPALVIVLATEQDRWRRAGISTRLIVADDSGFAPLRIEIKNGVVILRQEEQSNISENTNDYAYTYRFRYEPTADRFLLIGEDDANTHRDVASDGIRVSDNYLTGARVITIMHAARGKYVRETNTVRHIDTQRVFLEEATMQDIDFYQLMDEFRNPRSAPTRRKPR